MFDSQEARMMERTKLHTYHSSHLQRTRGSSHNRVRAGERRDAHLPLIQNMETTFFMVTQLARQTGREGEGVSHGGRDERGPGGGTKEGDRGLAHTAVILIPGLTFVCLDQG
jgi:hypothetical protein